MGQREREGRGKKQGEEREKQADLSSLRLSQQRPAPEGPTLLTDFCPSTVKARTSHQLAAFHFVVTDFL